jgi:flagellar basal-body rod protein FlgB
VTNAVAPNAGAGQSFSTALAQAISQAPGGGAHGSHGGEVGGMTASGANGAPHSGGHAASTGIPNGGTDPRHFPIGESNHGGDHGIQETVLGLRAYRQQLIASNIANADTPHYKAVDIDFSEAVRIARASMQAGSVGLALTDGRHIAGSAASTFQNIPLKYHAEYQPSADGNTVDMDVERAKFAENSVMYEFSLDRVKGHFTMMMEMLKNLT